MRQLGPDGPDAGCVRPRCDTDCAAEPVDAASGWLVALRSVRLALAVAGSCLVIVMATLVPGYGRVRRGLWAQRRGSRWILGALGVDVHTRGRPRSGASLVVANHVSFLDVLVLAAAAPMRMVAKREIGSWAVIGAAARRVGTLFVDRPRLSALPGAVDEISAALRAGHRVQVFPEATTRCGGALHPFHRAAFQAALDAGVVVSPATLRYRDGSGARSSTPAFLGQETLLVAMGRVLRMREMTVDLEWLPAIPAIPATGRPASDRRAVGRLAENAIGCALGVPVLRPIRRACADSAAPRPPVRLYGMPHTVPGR